MAAAVALTSSSPGTADKVCTSAVALAACPEIDTLRPLTSSRWRNTPSSKALVKTSMASLGSARLASASSTSLRRLLLVSRASRWPRALAADLPTIRPVATGGVMLSYTDADRLPSNPHLARVWQQVNGRTYVNRGMAAQVAIWFVRTQRGLSLMASYPANEIARTSMTNYVEMFQNICRQVAGASTPSPAFDPSVISLPDGSYRMYYFKGYFVTPPPANPGLNQFYLAESTDASATGASGATAGAAVAATVPVADALPEDPRQWPLARVRLTGLWQQGADRQAILSAGPHWARVRQGQRVTQEGHRVAAITEAGVSLRLAQGPMFELTWGERRDEPKNGTKR